MLLEWRSIIQKRKGRAEISLRLLELWRRPGSPQGRIFTALHRKSLICDVVALVRRRTVLALSDGTVQEGAALPSSFRVSPRQLRSPSSRCHMRPPPACGYATHKKEPPLCRGGGNVRATTIAGRARRIPQPATMKSASEVAPLGDKSATWLPLPRLSCGTSSFTPVQPMLSGRE